MFTIQQVSSGDAIGNLNTQQDAFQFGVNISTVTGPFTVHTRLLAPLFNGQTPQDFQSQGMYIGNGDQDNYLKIVLNANGGNGGIQILFEDTGTVVNDIQFTPIGLLTSVFVS